MELLILLIIALILTIFFIIIFSIRHYVIKTSVKKHSQFLAEALKLNKKYDSIIYGGNGQYVIDYACKSKKQYDKYIIKEYVSGYLCGYIGEDVDRWRDIYKKIESNKENYEKYLKEFGIIKEKYWAKSYQKIGKETAFFIFTSYQYTKYELKLCESQKIKAATSMSFTIDVNYTSPQGRNHYSSKVAFQNEEILRIFDQVESGFVSQQSIDYQRSLMTNSKRFDILNRDNFTCQLCGRTAQDGAKLEVDHIYPVSRGGKTTDDNLQTLCYECNQGKKAKVIDTSRGVAYPVKKK